MRDKKGVFFCGKVFLTSVFASMIFFVANASAYTVTFNATFGEFSDGSKTNVVEYNDAHEVVNGTYEDPIYNTGVDSSDFITWYAEYDAKNRVNLDEITSDTEVFAAYEKVTWRWDYTGDEQTFSLPITAGLQLHVWGAQGGSNTNRYGGYGGYSTGIYDFLANQNIYINVGGTTDTIDGGYNGGAVAATNYNGKGGGGATHIAVASGLLSTLEDNKESVAIVAGAGGGSHTYIQGADGGHGGGYIGNTARTCLDEYDIYARGGGQEAGGRGYFGGAKGKDGTFGAGGLPYSNHGAGGGAGWYGGGGGGYQSGNVGSGGGGSGYIGNTVANSRHMAAFGDDFTGYCAKTTRPAFTSDEDSTKTIETKNASEDPIEDYAKLGNGYAKAELTRLTITYANDFGTDTNTVKDQYVGSLAQELSITPRAGYTAAWYNGDTEWNFDDPVNFDLTLTAKYTPIVYSISYDLDGGVTDPSNPATYTVESDSFTFVNPTKDYYTFKGWSGTDLDGNENENVTIVTGSYGDREYTANFTPIEYSINYVLNGGENSSRNPSSYNVESSIQLGDAYKEGYDFTGWAEGSEITLGSHGDKTFTATYEIKHYNVTVSYDNNEVFNDTIDHGSDFPTLNIPEVAPGYERKYYNNGAEYDITQPVAGDLDITIVDEIITYNITYVMDGHTNDSNNPTSYTVNDADIVIADAEPKAYYYYFLGWTTNPNTEEDMTKDFEIPSGSTGDITLYAIFQQNPYTIEFDCEDFCEFEPITRIGEEPIGELPTPERDGYIFLGWYIDDNKLEPTSTPRSSATAVAKWEKIEAPNTGDNILKAATVFVLSSLALVALIIKKK